jgi:Fe-S-cluster-containing hydrogenase component 2/CRP-like cAMP-binding protein/thioredoxin reductase
VNAPEGRFAIAIIGGGPAGLSAAARAAVRDREAGARQPGYVLLEGYAAPAKTIQRYQKGKRVDAQPDYLDLRSDLRFTGGAREKILQEWSEDAIRLGINMRLGAQVVGLTGQQGDFTIRLADGSSLQAENIVLAAGMQEPKKCPAPGAELPGVQYQLDDASAYRNERIFVLGAGDAAIENAISLAQQNDVFIVDRNAEFVRLNYRNKYAARFELTKGDSRLKCFRETSVKRIETRADGRSGLRITLETSKGERQEYCDRILVRYGPGPPLGLLRSLGLASAEGGGLVLSRYCETARKGVYAVGSLSGCNLIKECLNQGYDVIEWIHGNLIPPIDEPLLQYQFCGLPGERAPSEYLERFRELAPMLRELSPVALRRFMIQSQVCVAYSDPLAHTEALEKVESLKKSLPEEKSERATFCEVLREGERLYASGERSLSFFTVVSGEVRIEDASDGPSTIQLGRGEFFGESSLLSGCARGETAFAAAGCVLIKTERPVMLKFMRSHPSLQEGIGWIFAVRALQRYLAPSVPTVELRELAGRLLEKDPKTNRPRTEYPAGAVLFKEGEIGDSVFLIQSGNVRLTRLKGTQQVLVGQLPAGQLVGEMAVLGDPQHRETVAATVASRVLKIGRADFAQLVSRDRGLLNKIQEQAAKRARERARLAASPHASELMGFLLDQGMGESMNTLVIDEKLCIGCDNCEKACASTHGGISRMSRKAGPTLGSVHIVDACRHCEQPHCMDDCPQNCIWRTPDGAVYIDNDACISCEACERSCPYGAIRMLYDSPPASGLLWWLLSGRGTGPGEALPESHGPGAKKLPRKCDQCAGLDGGPACVRACPTGAALRIGPEQYNDLVESGLS